MPIDHIAFPLPVVVKGYACLSGAEIELAEKDIDPAHPPSVGQAATENRPSLGTPPPKLLILHPRPDPVKRRRA